MSLLSKLKGPGMKDDTSGYTGMQTRVAEYDEFFDIGVPDGTRYIEVKTPFTAAYSLDPYSGKASRLASSPVYADICLNDPSLGEWSEPMVFDLRVPFNQQERTPNSNMKSLTSDPMYGAMLTGADGRRRTLADIQSDCERYIGSEKIGHVKVADIIKSALSGSQSVRGRAVPPEFEELTAKNNGHSYEPEF